MKLIGKFQGINEKDASPAGGKVNRHIYEQAWQVRGYTMLSMDLGVTFPFSTMKNWLCSFVDKNWFFTFEDNIGSMYYSKAEMEMAGRWGKKDFLNNLWFKKYIDNSRKLYKRPQKLFEKYSKEVLAKADEEKLYSIIREMGLLLADIYGYFNACQPQCVHYLEQDLENELKKSVPKNKVRELMLELTRPTSKSLLDEEELQWLSLCLKDIKIKRRLRQFLSEHSRKYGILGTSDGGSYYDIAYYEKLYKQRNIAAAKIKIKRKAGREETIKKIKTDLIKKYKLSGYVQKIAAILSKTGHERFELRLRGWMPVDYWFMNILLPHLEGRFRLGIKLFRQFTFLELLQFIQTGYYNRQELENRDDYFVTGMKDGRVFLRTGSDGRTVAKSLLPKIMRRAKEITGQAAETGFVRGLAYVLPWNVENITQEMEKMPAGSILVAGQTRPHLMPAIKKSSAIVTDEGGITSHAAIVSRELGIPCVIGTKAATKLIQTGDLIEVDADRGLIRIINN